MAETIFRADYRAPSHLIDTVHLEFDLDADSTSVINTMHVRPNPDAQHSSDLILNGETLTLVSVAVDGLPLDESRYTLGDDLLTIRGIDRECDVIVVNRFSPSANKALSGIYTSGQNLMSQCEAQGFRRITYFLDRPDVLSRYSVVIRASKEQYPVLLSNGNRIEEKDLDDGRHEARWEDPFPKPCYLFALVAGRLEALRDTIVLKDGRTASLEVWVEPQDIDKTQHTMDSLKKSIRWDEERWGLELDLDGFRIVATNDFNFGAMENKGLNIFNARYALANPKVATDQDYANIESVVGHEYFHNWTGDRVTLRDWFQLTLKEGLTVFRDQEFSADMLGDESARAVERIRNVKALRLAQFAEDAGPMAHPIRPDSYQEIDNFYTSTVYEKGAEVIRMLQTLLGKDTFRKGFDLYIARNDGHAVTCEAFLEAMEEASGRDLQQFRRWYSQAGTPRVAVSTQWNAEAGQPVLTVEQTTPPPPGQPAESRTSAWGLPRNTPPANAIALPPPKRGLTDEQWADIAYCLRVLTDYLDLLHDWRERYKPASPEEPLDERFVEALHMTETIEHLTDCVAFGTPQQKADAASRLLSGSYLLMLEERTDRLALAKCA